MLHQLHLLTQVNCVPKADQARLRSDLELTSGNAADDVRPQLLWRLQKA